MVSRFATVFCLVLFPVVTALAQGNNAVDVSKWNLDHYRFYTNSQGFPAVAEGLQDVRIRGQFDDELVARKVQQFLYLGNPSTKNSEPIRNKHAHLAWYALDTKRQQQPPRLVKATNQWGQHSFITSDLVGLLVPTEKIEDGSEFPKRLDHYAVYQIHTVKYPKGMPGFIDTSDQFGPDKECDIRVATHFAVPVAKEHAGRSVEIVNAKDHLLIYISSSRARLDIERAIRNQFHPDPTLIHPKMLYHFAVPTTKDTWELSEVK